MGGAQVLGGLRTQVLVRVREIKLTFQRTGWWKPIFLSGAFPVPPALSHALPNRNARGGGS